jgi:inner membrane protein
MPGRDAGGRNRRSRRISGTPVMADGKCGFMNRKVLLLGCLVLALWIPLMMISGLVSERQSRRAETEADIARTWAGHQVLLGPLLEVPYTATEWKTGSEGRDVEKVTTRHAYLLPHQFYATAMIAPQIRSRGIHDVVVYRSQISVAGVFNPDAMRALDIAAENIHWQRAVLIVAVTDAKGIERNPDLTWDGTALELLPGTASAPLSGLHVPVAIDPELRKSIPFQLKMGLKGSGTLTVTPLGKDSRIQMRSPWSSPAFTGNVLPDQRTVRDDGFSATWLIPWFARGYGQALAGPGELRRDVPASAVGAELYRAVDFYRQAERSMKYGILFIVLTFAVFFLFETPGGSRLHPFQYLLVGCAQCLFYLLLLPLSEMINFAAAYTVASAAVVSVIALYSRAILDRPFSSWLIGGLLTLLYGYLYVLLQLEDLSLLFGAIGLFAVLAAIMYTTRNFDWHSAP